MNKPILVFKFGGASVKDGDAIINVVRILERYNTHNILLVVSAMGKTTNNLEHTFQAFMERDLDVFTERLTVLNNYHTEIINSLFKPQEAGKLRNELQLVLEHTR